MKIPVSPRHLKELIDQETANISHILDVANSPTPTGKYLHWDKLRHRAPPADLTHEQWWLGVKFARLSLNRQLPMTDKFGRSFGFAMPPLVTEHLHEKIGAKTIFATHYHELTQLGDLLDGVKNMNVSVREVGDDIVFLRRLMEGGADRSYGIQVARLAGLPDGIVSRARELLEELEGTHTGGGEGLGRHGAHRPSSEPSLDQLSMFRVEHPLIGRLRALDPDELTPKEALTLLYELRRAATGGDG